MDDLTTWLKDCLDEIELSDWHERTCQTHQKMPPNSPLGLGGSPLSCYCRVPDFVLRDVEAKRRIITACESVLADSNTVNGYSDGISPAWLAERTLKLLALPFSDRPGYREDWAL